MFIWLVDGGSGISDLFLNFIIHRYLLLWNICIRICIQPTVLMVEFYLCNCAGFQKKL